MPFNSSITMLLLLLMSYSNHIWCKVNQHQKTHGQCVHAKEKAQALYLSQAKYRRTWGTSLLNYAIVSKVMNANTVCRRSMQLLLDHPSHVSYSANFFSRKEKRKLSSGTLFTHKKPSGALMKNQKWLGSKHKVIQEVHQKVENLPKEMVFQE